MQSQPGTIGNGPCNVYQPSVEELAEAKERNRRYEEGVLRQFALGVAIQYAVGREVSAAQIVKDAQAFVDFLTVK